MGGFAQFRIPTVITCLSLMMSDVPTTFPKRVERLSKLPPNGCPGSLKKRSGAAARKAFPSCRSTFNIYVTTETNDDFEYVLRYAGEDNVVIGTDYGHTDASAKGTPSISRAAILSPIRSKRRSSTITHVLCTRYKPIDLESIIEKRILTSPRPAQFHRRAGSRVAGRICLSFEPDIAALRNHGVAHSVGEEQAFSAAFL